MEKCATKRRALDVSEAMKYRKIIMAEREAYFFPSRNVLLPLWMPRPSLSPPF